MVLLKTLKVSLDCNRNLSAVLHCEEMPNDLAVMLRLAWEAERGISFLLYFGIGHNLNFLEWRRRLNSVGWRLRHLAIHKRRFGMEIVEKGIFDDADVGAVLDRISPDPSDFPNIDLPIGDDVAPCRGEMPADPGADAVD